MICDDAPRGTASTKKGRREKFKKSGTMRAGLAKRILNVRMHYRNCHSKISEYPFATFILIDSYYGD